MIHNATVHLSSSTKEMVMTEEQKPWIIVWTIILLNIKENVKPSVLFVQIMNYAPS